VTFAEWLANEPGFAILVALVAFLCGVILGEREGRQSNRSRREW